MARTTTAATIASVRARKARKAERLEQQKRAALHEPKTFAVGDRVSWRERPSMELTVINVSARSMTAENDTDIVVDVSTAFEKV